MKLYRFDIRTVIDSYMAYLLRTCKCCYMGDPMCKNADEHFGIIEFYVASQSIDTTEKQIEILAE